MARAVTVTVALAMAMAMPRDSSGVRLPRGDQTYNTSRGLLGAHAGAGRSVFGSGYACRRGQSAHRST